MSGPSTAPTFDPSSEVAPAHDDVLETLSNETGTIQIQYVVERPVVETKQQDGKVVQRKRYVREVKVAAINLTANLEEKKLSKGN